MNCQICLKTIHKDLAHSSGFYHSACLKQFFGQKNISPVLPLSASEFYQKAPAIATGFSISGAQVKMQMKVESGQLLLCASGGDYILKPSPQAFPQAAENEHLCLQIAKLLQFDIPPVALLYFADKIPVFAIKRFDRQRTSTEHRQHKIHQEDLMQAMGLANQTGQSKYNYSYQQVLQDLVTIAHGLPLAAEFFKRLLLAYLIGNDDLHLKNISLLYTSEGIRLTPVYDYLNTALYGINESVLALSMLAEGKQPQRFNQIANGYYYVDDFIELGLEAGLSGRFIRASIKKLISKTDKIVALVQNSPLSPQRQEQFIAIIHNRKARLEV